MNMYSGFSDHGYRGAPGHQVEINEHSHIPPTPPSPTSSISYAPIHGYQFYPQQHQDYVPYFRPSVISTAGRRRSSSDVLNVTTRQPTIPTGEDCEADEGSKKRLRRTNSLGGEPLNGMNRETTESGSGAVVGPVVASSRRNAEFHELFPDIPEGDYLIDDYICSLERVIVVQGRLFISENCVSFYSNISGWVTQLSFALLDIISLKKAPYDSLYITTAALEHKLVSFLARDTAYDVLDDTWRRARSRGDIGGRYEDLRLKATICTCLRDGKHYKVTLLDTIFPGTPEKVHNLIFVSRFTWSFLKYVQGSTDIHISDWSATSLDTSRGHLTRNMSYLKPRVTSSGPQWTKHDIRDETIHCDFNEYVSVISTTRTPISPSGSAFVIKTRTCIMWAFGKSSRVLVTTQLEWTGKSFLKDIIAQSAIDDQRSYYKALESAVRTNISSDQPDFSTPTVDRHPITSVSGPVDSVAQYSNVSSSSTTAGVFSVQPSPTDSAMSSSHQLVADIRTLLATETAAASLLALEASGIPPVLDLLQAEIRTTGLSQEHRRRCGKYLRLLVNKHRFLPPSLFAKEVEMSGAHPIDVGGYSDIYQGTFGNESVCLKVLRIHIQENDERVNKDLREFYKEALLWTQLDHPNLLPFLGVNTTLFPRRLCLVSPWMVNGQVTKYLETHPGHDRLKVLSEVSAGISYLHSHNIVHGDIKGANILVDEHGRCYLADFGLAGASMTTTLLSSTTNSVGKGTMRWMAPELFGDNGVGAGMGASGAASTDSSDDSPGNSRPSNIKPAIDIYAFACTVYEVISGKLPFAHLSDPQVMLKVVFGVRPERPTSVGWCPDNVWALVEQCWAHESRLRPTAADVYAFLSHLEELRGEGFAWEEERFLPVCMGAG